MSWPWVRRKRLQAVEMLLATEVGFAKQYFDNAAKHERNSKTLQSVVNVLREEARGLREAAVKLKAENVELAAKLNKSAASKGTFNPRRVPFHAAGGARQILENAAFEESAEGRKIRTAEAVLGDNNGLPA